jgi:hypothetical protein
MGEAQPPGTLRACNGLSGKDNIDIDIFVN